MTEKYITTPSAENEFGQPLDFEVPGWTPCERPPATAMGRFPALRPATPYVSLIVASCRI